MTTTSPFTEQTAGLTLADELSADAARQRLKALYRDIAQAPHGELMNTAAARAAITLAQLNRIAEAWTDNPDAGSMAEVLGTLAAYNESNGGVA